MARCTCPLVGRAHYARRCPRCGLYRDPTLVRAWQPTPEVIQAGRAARRRAAAARRERARELLARIVELCQRPAPALPVATPPRRPMSWHERRAWQHRASGWEVCMLYKIREELEEPIRLLRDLQWMPAQARYVRAARQAVQDYVRRMADAGWQLKM